MIELHPIPQVNHKCPGCEVPLDVVGWYIPGMRNLADLRCEGCKREFYGDIPVGGALYYTMLLDKHSGEVFDPHGVKWFADWLRESYAHRRSDAPRIEDEWFEPVRRPVLLNCLDRLYGHCLLKLLNAQYYIDAEDYHALVLLVPKCLRWMAPEGAAAIFSVDQPLSEGADWNDGLAEQVRRRIAPLHTAALSVALSHPHPDDYDIERFTRVMPFPLSQWQRRLERPTVTFIWRDDRAWRTAADDVRAVADLAATLRDRWAALDFAIAGIGAPGGFPSEIADLRTEHVDESVERQWCRRYAASHVVVGVHGSNMLLPSGHAGAAISLTPPDRWCNVLQDMLFRGDETRDAAYRYRAIPTSVAPAELAVIISSMLRSYDEMSGLMWTDACRHVTMAPPNQIGAAAGTSRDLNSEIAHVQHA